MFNAKFFLSVCKDAEGDETQVLKYEAEEDCGHNAKSEYSLFDEKSTERCILFQEFTYYIIYGMLKCGSLEKSKIYCD